jgi:2,5-diketo-D-gluconate reductase A
MENLNSFGFTLSDKEMVALGSLDRPDPEMLDADSFGH